MAEGVVTTHVFELIVRQVEDYSLVVWYDPEQAYAAEVASLTIPQTQVAQYEGSFFSSAAMSTV